MVWRNAGCARCCGTRSKASRQKLLNRGTHLTSGCKEASPLPSSPEEEREKNRAFRRLRGAMRARIPGKSLPQEREKHSQPRGRSRVPEISSGIFRGRLFPRGRRRFACFIFRKKK